MADYIDRGKLLEAIRDGVAVSGRPDKPSAELRGIRKVVDRIEAADTEDVEPVRHGYWDSDDNCSCCGADKYDGLDADVWAVWVIPYCPHCGAKMDKEGH